MKWVYMGIIRLKVMYSLGVLANRACNYYKSLDRLQCLAILTMTNVRRTTTTMGAEILTRLMPLDLFIQETAVKTTLRIYSWNLQLWDGIRHGKSRGHLYQALRILKDCAFSSQQIDKEGTWRWDKKFTVTRNNVLVTSSSIRCYTRGTMF